MIPFLIFLAVLCAVIGVMFFFYDRVYKHGRKDALKTISDWAANESRACSALAQKRKGNNFGDQMYRAAIKGHVDAFDSVVFAAHTLDQSK